MKGNHHYKTILEEKEPLLPSSEHQGLVSKPRSCPRRLRLLTLVTVALGFVIIFSAQTFAKISSELASDNICLTPECVLASAEIISSRSPNYADIEPCDDFRTYICEGFDNSHDLRPDQSDVGTLSVLAERGQALLRRLLEAPSPSVKTAGKASSADKANFEKLQDAYGACLNETIIKAKGAAPLINILKKVHATFDSQGSEELSLLRTFSFLTSIGVEPLVQFGIEADEKDPDVNVLYIASPGSIGLPAKEYYEDQDLLKRYSGVIQEVTDALRKELGPEVSTAGTFNVTALVDFEVKLARASPSEEERGDVQKSYNPRTLSEAAAMIPQVDIPGLIKIRNADFNATKVIVEWPDYLVSLSKILKETEKDTVMFHIMWTTIQDLASRIEDDAVTPLKRFGNVLQGKEPDAMPERWRTCLRHVDGGLGWILSRFFIEDAFSEEAREFGDEIIMDIKDEFTRKLNTSEWMSKDVRKVAIDKVHNIIQKIGYPTASPDIRDPRKLKDYYAGVKISSDTYFDNSMSMTRDQVEKEWEKASKPVNREEWGMTASTVNAYYNPAGNEIVFPAGIMQPAIFYPPELPKYLSYGAFGAVSGHELSHAFDSTGRHFDQNGNYTDWWDTATVDEFERKAECFVQQYNNFTIDGPDGKPHNVNGRLTLGENLADAGGLSAAFNAWKRREAERPAQLLPGLQEYTKEQMFFLSFGKVWCGKTREEEKLRRLYSDPHSPTAARVMLTVANSGEFRESFGCKAKAATCKLW